MDYSWTWVTKPNNEFNAILKQIESLCYKPTRRDDMPPRNYGILTLYTPTTKIPEIKNVIFNDPATIVYWADGTKTVVKCQRGDTYSKETGLAMAITKKVYGNKGSFNDVFTKWLGE